MATVNTAKGTKATKEAEVADKVKMLEARSTFARSLETIGGGDHALKTLATLAIADNPATKTLIVGGDNRGAVGMVAGLAQAVMGQVTPQNPPAPVAPAPVQTTTPQPAAPTGSPSPPPAQP